MVRPVLRRLHLLLTILTILVNLWLASCSKEEATAFRQSLTLKTPAIKVKQSNSEQHQHHQPVQPSSTLPGRGHPQAAEKKKEEEEEAIYESSTLNLFHLSKASKCCQLTSEPSCKLNCIQGMSHLKVFESKCAQDAQKENGETCLEEVELLSIKKQFIVNLESKCGQPLTVDSSEQLWMCLLTSGYFEQTEEQQQQQQQQLLLSTHANSAIFTDLGEASNLELTFTKQQQQQQHSIVNASLNPAKWLCCERARSQRCRQLCYSSLDNEWTDNWEHFAQHCINQGAKESRLRQCLMEGKGQQCVYGCRSGLSSLPFCGAVLFNKPNGRAGGSLVSLNHHQQHHLGYYRDCSVEADQAAAGTYRRWLSTDYVHHYSDKWATLPFQNLSSCQLDLWRLLACTLHLKPCRPDQDSTEAVCRSSCKMLVDECIDTKVQNSDQFDSDAFCNKLNNRLTKANSEDYTSSEDVEELIVDADDDIVGDIEETAESSCINLTQLIVNLPLHQSSGESERNGAMSTSSEVELTHNVCKENKCTKEQLCLRNQDCTVENCEPYRCVNACTIGKLRELKVPQETFVNLPAIDAQNLQMVDGVPGQLESCHHLCYCNADGQLVDCKFYCTNQRSEVVQARAEEAALAQIECISACPHEYKPFCEHRTNQNYFNACIRDCALQPMLKLLMADDQKGDASGVVHNHKWKTADCGRGTDLQRSVSIICPSSTRIDNNCTVETGTQLVPLSTDLHHITRKTANIAENLVEFQALALENVAVCDTHGEGHANLRSFVCNHHKIGRNRNQSNNNSVSFAYFGQCLNYCSLFSPVCGRDGADYQSECVAHSHHLLVDHFGSCHSSDRKQAAPNKKQTITCPEIRCPAHHFVHYLPLNRCPFCGSVAYFHLAADNFLASISRPADRQHLHHWLLRRSQLTVQALSQQLRQLVSVNVCQLFVHQLGGGGGRGGEGLLVVLMRASFNINQKVAFRQQTLCEVELRRLVKLVKERSPAVQLLLPLSLLRYNETVAQRMAGLTLQEKDGAGGIHNSATLLVVCLLYSIIWWK